jgi:hypothetical protein
MTYGTVLAITSVWPTIRQVTGLTVRTRPLMENLAGPGASAEKVPTTIVAKAHAG